MEAEDEGIGILLLEPPAMTWTEELEATTRVWDVAAHAISG